VEKTYTGNRIIVFARSDFENNPHHPTLFDDFLDELGLLNNYEPADLLTLWIHKAEAE